MALVGYARVSTTDQDLTHQIAVLTSAGCRKIFSEKMTGTTKEGRQALDDCLDYLREGDTLVITRIDLACHAVCATYRIWCMSLKGKTSSSGRPSRPSIPLRRPARLSWICWAFSPSLRHACVRNGNGKALPARKPGGAYKEESSPLRRKRSR